ncbi:MAG: heavy metal translocating P-type ATPase [Ignavibacteriaceae bacterium]|jgi:Cu+-exporting ATPase|nr:heavy metal translocating P-type ATPase [Ignavibacteriaceae bacterium]
MEKIILPVKGMTCASCVTRVEKITRKIEGIKNVSVNLANETLSFDSENSTEILKPLSESLSQYGYDIDLSVLSKKDTDSQVYENSNDEYYKEIKSDFIFALIFTIPIFIISMLLDYTWFQDIWILNVYDTQKILLILTTPVMFIPGKRFFKSFAKNLIHFSADMNSLVAIGTGAAYIYSLISVLFPSIISHHPNAILHVYFETAAVIITLILMGKLLEHRAKRKTNSAIAKLLELRPETALIIENNIEKEIPISELRKDHIVIVKPGTKVPSDGIITSGISTIDESMITGESIPVEKGINTKIFGGTINKFGAFNYRVTETGDNSLLGQIIKLVESAQASKAPIQKLADKISGVFVPVVILIALITFLGWFFISGENSFILALTNSVAVLIIACPCALGLATPTAIIVGTGLGASKGILIKNSETLEWAHKIDTMLFDKTGTLTKGKPFVVDFKNFTNNEEVLRIAASLESKSEHPLAKALVEYSKKQNVVLTEPEQFESFPGFGIKGIVDKKNIIIGNIKFIKKHLADIKIEIDENSGTSIITIIENKLAAIFQIDDEIKEDAKETIDALHKLGIKTIMLTGDNNSSAKRIAEKLGIDDYRSELLPNQKSDIIIEFQDKGNLVGFTGDGVNDAPALAKANLGISLASGTDIAIESSDIAIINDNLINVVNAIKISNKTIKIIRQNLFWAFVYNVIGIPLAAFGFLNPMIGALAMSLSSVSVVSNSLRLRFTKF